MEKFQRKHFFINKRLQTRYMISMLVPMLILILFIGLVMYYSQYKFLIATTREMSKDINDNIIAINSMYLSDDCERNAKNISEIKGRLALYKAGQVPFSSSLLKTTYRILFAGLAVVMIELGFLTVFISHKVAGPVYRLSKFAEEVGNGNFNAHIYLRKGDELMDVAMDFNKTSDFLKATFGKALTINDQLITLAKSGQADASKVAMLQRETDDLKAKIKIS
jgi:methyl-accepting chemotaxis protein